MTGLAVNRIQPSPSARFGETRLSEPLAFAQFGGRNSTFDSFQLSRTQPASTPATTSGFLKSWTQPALRSGLSQNAKASGETVQERVAMYNAVAGALSRDGLEHFKNLYKEGVLTDITADDNHSTLYHLYAILATPRLRGLDRNAVLNETVRILNKPYLISQKFPVLAENYAKMILQARNTPTLNRANEPSPLQPLSREDLKVEFSSDCVPASVMYYMAEKNPSELARHLNELTSPMEAFYEKAKLSEISPENPAEAIEVLKYYDIPYVRQGSDEVLVRVDLPVAGKLRMLNDIQKKTASGARSGIETAYQSALAYLPTRSYDPATGQRDAMEATIATIYQVKSLSDQEKQDLAGILQNNKSPQRTLQAFFTKFAELESKLTLAERTQIREAMQSPSRGLTEMEKTLLETIIKDNGGISSVTYQVVAGKANPRPGEEIQSFLYGYTRTFEQMTADMVEALKMGEFVIIGITDTDYTGAIVGGHEITITGAFVDKAGEIQFVVVDSDDDIPNPVVRSARELIPRIHHAGLPNKLADNIRKEMEQVEGYFVPGKEDRAQFSPIERLNEPLPAEMMAPPPEPAKQPEKQPAQPVVKAEPPKAPAPKKSSPEPQQPVYPSNQILNSPIYATAAPYAPVAPFVYNPMPFSYAPVVYNPQPVNPFAVAPYPAANPFAQPYLQQPTVPFTPFVPYTPYPAAPAYRLAA